MARASTLRLVLRQLQHFVSRDWMNDVCDDHGLPRRKSYDDCIDQLCRELDGQLGRLVSPATRSMTRDDWNDFLEQQLDLPRRKSYDDIIAELEAHFGAGDDGGTDDQEPARPHDGLRPNGADGESSTLRQVLEDLRKFITIDLMNDICEDHGLRRRKSFDDAIDDLCAELDDEVSRLVCPATRSFSRDDWNDFLEQRLGRARRKSYEDVVAEIEDHYGAPGRAGVRRDPEPRQSGPADEDTLPEREIIRVAEVDPRMRVDVRLEDFQQEAVTRLSEALLDGRSPRARRSGILCLPTGGGKTRTALEWLFTRFVNDGKRVLWVTHKLDLLDQVHREIRELAFLAKGHRDTISVTRYDGANGGRHATDGDFVLASVASIASRGPRADDFENGRTLGAICYDEAHRSSAPEWWYGLKGILDDTDAPLLGLTATPFRGTDRGNENLQAIYGPRPIYEASFRDLIHKGFLAKPKFVRHRLKATEAIALSAQDVQEIRRLDDITEAVLSRLAQDEGRSREIVQHWSGNRQEYGKTVVFACNIRHAERLAEMFRDGGADAAAVHSKLDMAERARRLRWFRDERSGAPVLVNVGLLTEGWNVPNTLSVLMARPTLSKVLYMQMIGRGSRGPKACPGKDTFNVLDFVDNFDRHGFHLAGREVAAILGAEYEAETRPETKRPDDLAQFEGAITDAVGRLLQRQLAVEQYSVWGELRWPAEGGWRSVAVFVETLPALENAVRLLNAALGGNAEWSEVGAIASQLDQEGAIRAADWEDALRAARNSKRAPELVRVEVDAEALRAAQARADLLARARAASSGDTTSVIAACRRIAGEQPSAVRESFGDIGAFIEAAVAAADMEARSRQVASPAPQPEAVQPPIASALDLGMAVAAADGVILPEEEQALAHRIEALYELQRPLGEQVTLRAQAWRAGQTVGAVAAASALSGRPYHERLLLLDVMFRVAIADGRLVAEERHLLEQAAHALRVPSAEVDDRLAWWKDVAARAPVVPGFRTCSGCGLTWNENHNFCSSCGTRLGGAPAGG